jgi:protein-S-isoprenylcysteine O-methyltransferase Ste14
VFKQNAYASRIIETSEEQQVISTGLYGIVRHPMYLGSSSMYVFTPIALGSWWAVIPALLILPVIVMRIRNEEKVLAKDLPGYSEYLQKVKYRLIPGVW